MKPFVRNGQIWDLVFDIEGSLQGWVSKPNQNGIE